MIIKMQAIFYYHYYHHCYYWLIRWMQIHVFLIKCLIYFPKNNQIYIFGVHPYWFNELCESRFTFLLVRYTSCICKCSSPDVFLCMSVGCWWSFLLDYFLVFKSFDLSPLVGHLSVLCCFQVCVCCVGPMCCWHDLDNSEYDCWPLDQPNEYNMIDCGGENRTDCNLRIKPVVVFLTSQTHGLVGLHCFPSPFTHTHICVCVSLAQV